MIKILQLIASTIVIVVVVVVAAINTLLTAKHMSNEWLLNGVYLNSLTNCKIY